MASLSAVKVATPEIRWHCGPTGLNEAVLSLDFLHAAALSPSVIDADADRKQESAIAVTASATILATGGADKEIKLWRVQPEHKESEGLEFIFSLSGHDRSVNCVRFSPNGQYLASASDDSTILIWTKPKTAGEDWSWDRISSFSDISRTLLACGHKGDITDLTWSPDSMYLCSASVDNCAVVWNVEKGEVAERRKDHTQYVQGVAWDPLGEFLVTQGNDRTCRVYALSGFDPISRLSTKKLSRRCSNMITIKSREFPSSATETALGGRMIANNAVREQAPATEDLLKGASKHRMFLDDTCPVFARRLTWTPDGNYVLAPTGVFRSSGSASPVNTVYAFARGNMGKPALHLPGHEKPSLGVRCSPLLYKLRTGDSAGSLPNFFQTPLRSIFAVITLNAVVVYDTQQTHPLCTIKNLHYADLTDASWSADGQTLSVSSMDGYVSFIRFDIGFFGISIPIADRLRMNDECISTMFTVTKASKKKTKVQVSADDLATGGKTSVASKKSPLLTSPLMQAFQKRDVSKLSANDALTAATSAAVHTLQARKKRKIVPTLVTNVPPGAA